MKLIDNFFKVLSSASDETSGTYEIALCPDHFVFSAHFPGNPITPGVCQIGIVEELLSQQVGTPLQVTYISNIKYMALLSPTDNAQLSVRLSNIVKTDEGYEVQGVLSNASAMFTKMSLRLSPIH